MYNWVHVLCALFVPETKIVHMNTMQPVEYVGAIKPSRWEQVRYMLLWRLFLETTNPHTSTLDLPFM